MPPSRDILCRPRSIRLMIAGGVAAGVVALAVLVLIGVPWWRAGWAPLLVNGLSVASSLAGVGVVAWWRTHRAGQ